MNEDQPLSMNTQQQRMFDTLAERLATRASNSELSIDRYLDGLQAFLFGSASDRTHVRRREPELYKRMELDQNSLLNILAAADGHTLGLVTGMIKLLKVEVIKKL